MNSPIVIAAPIYIAKRIIPVVNKFWSLTDAVKLEYKESTQYDVNFMFSLLIKASPKPRTNDTAIGPIIFNAIAEPTLPNIVDIAKKIA